VPEVAITESTATKFAVAAKFTATDSFGHPAATEFAEAATAEGASHAAMETAATKAAAVETAAAEATAVAAAAVATAPAPAATRQCHCWCSQAN
jgi:isopentenyl phosphate kinase